MDLEELVSFDAESPEEEKVVYELFKWSVIIKGVISVAEVIAGLALLLIPPAYFVSIVQGISAWLAAHAEGALALKLTAELAAITHGAVIFIALYLLIRGLIKSLLIYGLLRNILWSYPASLFVLGLFVLYQIYEIAAGHSSLIIGITIFDLIVMYFIWREWHIVKSKI